MLGTNLNRKSLVIFIDIKCRLPDVLWSSQAAPRQANLIKITRPFRRPSSLPGHPAMAVQRAAGTNGRGVVV